MANQCCVHENMLEWLDKYGDEFKPPIGNKIMFNNQLIVFFVKGPNQRIDFHIEHGEEIFFMIHGNMNLIIMANGVYKNVVIKEGEFFVLPPRIYHSPQRLENTLGFVIERQRDPEKEYDGIIFFDKESSKIKHDVYVNLVDLQRQIRDLTIKALKDINEGNCSVTHNPPIKPQENINLMKPISLANFMKENESLIQTTCCVSLLSKEYQSKIHILSNGKFEFIGNAFDTIIWIFRGSASLTIGSEIVQLNISDFYLIKSGLSAILTISQNDIVIKMSNRDQ